MRHGAPATAEIAAGMGVAFGTPFPDVATALEISPAELLVSVSEPQPDMGSVEHAESGWTRRFGKLERLLVG